MSFKNKILGKKIEKESLQQLMESLEIPKTYLQNNSSTHSVKDYWGRYGTRFEKEGLVIDLYIFRKDVQWYDSVKGPFYFHTQNFHFKKIVPYNKIKI